MDAKCGDMIISHRRSTDGLYVNRRNMRDVHWPERTCSCSTYASFLNNSMLFVLTVYCVMNVNRSATVEYCGEREHY